MGRVSAHAKVREVEHSPGTWNEVSGTWSGMTELGRTNAPMETSFTASVTVRDVEDDAPNPNDDEAFWDRLVRITLAKWVGTAMFGGLPITS